ncbi:MAG: hypothetical protein ACRYHA_21920 [Janthinobacterium lividum]
MTGRALRRLVAQGIALCAAFAQAEVAGMQQAHVEESPRDR